MLGLFDKSAKVASSDAHLNGHTPFGGDIPATPTWQSKRGKHRLFRRPPGLPKKATVKLDGIEFRIDDLRQLGRLGPIARQRQQFDRDLARLLVAWI